MLAPGKIWPGSQLDITVSFRDEDGEPVDPATVTFRTNDPAWQKRAYVFGADSELTKQSVGNYTARITPDRAGRWFFRWETTGTGTTVATEGDFLVQRSPFVNDDYPCWDYR